MPVKNVNITQQSFSVQFQDLLVQTNGNISVDSAGSVLELAKRAGVDLYSYTGDQLTSITYADFEGVTNHTKSLTYVGDNLTEIQEIFDYDGNNYTYDVELFYSGNFVSSKTATLTVV